MKLIPAMLVLLIIPAVAFAADTPKGTVPLAGADKYAAHTEQNGVAIGATLLTSKQTRKIFRTDVDRCCAVVEVAIYPQKDGTADISLNDFTLRIVGQDLAAKPSTSKVAAWRSSHDSDRLRPRLIEVMEQELDEKGLPEGTTSTPVSGYLYFLLAKTKKAKHQLEYLLNGNKVVLALD